MSKIELPNSIDIKIKATHFEPFINKNAVKYTEKAIKAGVNSWIKPYQKPQLTGHDKNSSPLGRIINCEIIKDKKSSDEPSNYIRLYARITDKDAIEKILDGRFNTVSVGSKSSRVLCSECSQVITEDGLCDHKKGSYNEKGDMIHWVIDQIEYTEDSFVNEPADEYAGIEEVNFGNGWIEYRNFLDNRETHLKEISMEDCMTVQTDAKLSTEARNKLSESVFCGPGRSFPAHDKAHVLAGLKLIGKSKFSDSTKSKIKACLYRKGKRYGVVPSEDELKIDTIENLLTFGVDDEWTTEQRTELETFFKDNPDADLPDANDTQTDSNTVTSDVKIEDMKKPELVILANKLQKEFEDLKKSNLDALTLRDNKITDLTKKLSDSETLALQKEDEISKYLDDHAILSKKLKDSLVFNIIDLKTTDNNNEESKILIEKYSKRSVESLNDTLNDLRNLKIDNKQNTEVKVVLTTSQADNSDKNLNDQKNDGDKFKLFDQDRRSTEE
ncbi:MAG: hypothetical protein M0R17_05445 [Candidatus Omnitrophica bacterium]|jgi:hypothetical protein|nr:hypothetical protein [Candidatus Omnitrophota bacterium]